MEDTPCQGHEGKRNRKNQMDSPVEGIGQDGFLTKESMLLCREPTAGCMASLTQLGTGREHNQGPTSVKNGTTGGPELRQKT